MHNCNSQNTRFSSN